MRTTSLLFAVALLGVACGGSTAERGPEAVPDASTAQRDGSPVEAGHDADASVATDAPAGPSTCGAQPTSQACVTCCRQPRAPNYGGFELYGYETCQACSASCAGASPCGTNVTPPAGSACVQCLQKQLSLKLPSNCLSEPVCRAFMECLQTCPVR